MTLARALRKQLADVRSMNLGHSLTCEVGSRAGYGALVLAGALFGVLLTQTAAGQTEASPTSSGVVSVHALTGAEPGKTDPLGIPAGRYHLFSDDGLYALRPLGPGAIGETYQTDSALSMPLDQVQPESYWVEDPYGYGPIPVYATAGRFVSAAHDDVVLAYRKGNPADPRSTVLAAYGADASERSGGVDLPGTLLVRQKESSDFLAIAHGDLDHEAGKDGELHDEVVVVSVSVENSEYYGYDIKVLNYAEGDVNHPEVSRADYADYKPLFNDSPKSGVGGALPSENVVSVTLGDFLGDGKQEIAVVSLGNSTVLVYFYAYERAGDHHVLRQLGSNYFIFNQTTEPTWNDKPMVATIAAKAADLNGDGKDELAIAYSKWGDSPTHPNVGQYAVGVALLEINSRFGGRVVTNKIWPVGGLDNKDFGYATRPRVNLVAGQFLLNPPSIPLGRRQMVLGWLDTGRVPGATAGVPEVDLRALAVSDDLGTVTTLGAPYRGTEPDGVHLFELAAGGYQGTSGTYPLDNLALSYWAGIFLNNRATSALSTLRVSASGITLGSRDELPSDGIDFRAHWPLVAYDQPGRSRYLGAPVHMTVFSAPSTDYIMQEPPKHVYWSEQNHRVENLTRFDKNNVHLFNGSSASMSTNTKDQSSRDTGGSVAASAGLTVKSGANFGIIKGSIEVSADVQVKAGYDYHEHEESYNSGYAKRTTESSGQTDRDDFLKGEMNTADIWRYRVFGTPKDGSTSAYYELVFPGPKVPFVSGGLNLSWYQPIHENGNILSYPSQLGTSRLLPEDIGSFRLPDGTVIVGSPQVPPQLSYFDGTGTSTALKFSSEVSEGKSFTYTHKITESADIKTSLTTGAEAFGNGVKFRVSGSIEAHNSNSWGGSDTSTSTTTDETSVILNRAAGVATDSYPFYPVIYNTQDGTMRMTFAVPNPADPFSNPLGYSTYADQYGAKPDPALNLPVRFLPKPAGPGQLEEWEPNLTASRKAMRGLFFRRPELDPITNTYLLQASNPEDGDVVRIEPRVYNYSTAKTAAAIDVEYQVIPYDSSVNSEICVDPINAKPGVVTGLVCPRSARQTIGRTVVPKLDPLQFSCVTGMDSAASNGCSTNSAFVDWNTAGFAPAFGTNEYRVYVVLNPYAEAGSETYGLEPEPVAVTHVSNTTPMVVTAPGSRLETGDYVTIGSVRGLDRANGTYRVTLVSNDSFSLDGTVLSQGSYEGGGFSTKLDPGQNNEGYGLMGVTHKAASEERAALTNRRAKDFLEDDALEAVTEDQQPRLKKTEIEARQGVPLQLRFAAHSDVVHTDAAQVLLFDGDPSTGTPSIAAQVFHPGENGPAGSYTWFNWTPTTAGVHRLYAVLIEGPKKSQEAGEIEVNVLAVSR